MQLCVVGIDHSTAPVAIRERLAFSPEQAAEALALLAAPGALAEAVIISTCNRVEVYGVASDEDAPAHIASFLAAYHGVDPRELAPHLFSEAGDGAALHLCETAAGLHSIVLGEAQIQGQVRVAIERARAAGSAGPVLTALFRHALAAGRRVRRETALGEGPASVSQAGVELARQHLGDLRGCTVLLVGSGEVSELAARNLRAYGASELLVANRTLERAQALAERWGAEPHRLDELPNLLARADIVISATAAPAPLIEQRHVEAAMRAKLEGACVGVTTMRSYATSTQLAPQMLLIDLAVPRDIAPNAAMVPGVRLCTVDDLQGIIHDTLARRREVVVTAGMIVADEVDAFGAWLRSQAVLPDLARWRQQADEMRQAEVERALHNLPELAPEHAGVIEALSRALVNRLLHTPTLRLKQAAAEGEGEHFAAMLNALFNQSR